MASITIRGLDDLVKTRLRTRAAKHGRSMEAEAREILRSGVAAEKPGDLNLVECIRQLFGPLGGVELRIPKREPMRKPLRF